MRLNVILTMHKCACAFLIGCALNDVIITMRLTDVCLTNARLSCMRLRTTPPTKRNLKNANGKRNYAANNSIMNPSATTQLQNAFTKTQAY